MYDAVLGAKLLPSQTFQAVLKVFNLRNVPFGAFADSRLRRSLFELDDPERTLAVYPNTEVVMDNTEPFPASPQFRSINNPVEQAADMATDAIEATRLASRSAIDAASSTVDSVRGTLSPYVDAVIAYTRKEPIKALAWAVFAGIAWSRLTRSSRR